MKTVFVFVLILALCIGGGAISYAGGAPVLSSSGAAVTSRGGEPVTAERPTSANADKTAYRLSVGNKAARGTKNVLFGWTELPKSIVDTTQETNNPLLGITAGTFKGVLKAVARTVSGVADVVTAPIAPEKGSFIKADIAVD